MSHTFCKIDLLTHYLLLEAPTESRNLQSPRRYRRRTPCLLQRRSPRRDKPYDAERTGRPLVAAVGKYFYERLGAYILQSMLGAINSLI